MRNQVLLIAMLMSVAGCGAVEHEASLSARGAPVCPARDLMLATKTLKTANDPCQSWLKGVLPNVARTSFGSSAVVKVANVSFGHIGLLMTARHVANMVPAEDTYRKDPFTGEDAFSRPYIGAQQALSNGTGSATSSWSVLPLFAPATLPSDANELGQLVNIWPRRDFVVGLVSADEINLDMGQVPSYPLDYSRPIPVKNTAIATPVAGQQAMLVGFPAAMGPNLVYSTGVVLSDTEAKKMLAATSDLEESKVRYEPEVEFLVTTRGLPGNSGGPVFDVNGQYLGIAVRASMKAPYFTRVVRAEFVMRGLVGEIDCGKIACSPRLKEVTKAIF